MDVKFDGTDTLRDVEIEDLACWDNWDVEALKLSLTPTARGLLGVPRLPTFWPIAGLGKLGRESFRARSKRLAETLPTILYTS